MTILKCLTRSVFHGRSIALIVHFATVWLLFASPTRAQVPTYFPLSNGDTFTYFSSLKCPPEPVSAGQLDHVSVTTDSVLIDGKVYFVKNRFFLSPDTLRVDSVGNVIVRNQGEDKLFYKINAAVGESWNLKLISNSGRPYDFAVAVTSRTDTVKLNAGTFEKCMKFTFDSPLTDGDMAHWLAPGVGLVFRCAQVSVALFSANVGGKQYPASTSVQDNEDERPPEFALNQNYPNPFNSQTVVGFSALRSAHLQVVITDLTGRCVKRLFDKLVQQGRYSVSWDGSDASSNTAASGTYVCELIADGTIRRSIKIVLIK